MDRRPEGSRPRLVCVIVAAWLVRRRVPTSRRWRITWPRAYMARALVSGRHGRSSALSRSIRTADCWAPPHGAGGAHMTVAGGLVEYTLPGLQQSTRDRSMPRRVSDSRTTRPLHETNKRKPSLALRELGGQRVSSSGCASRRSATRGRPSTRK